MIKTKHYIFLTILFCVFNTPFTLAQDIDIDKKISVNIKNKTLSEALTILEQKAAINFSYSTENIPLDKKVSVHATDKPFVQILDVLLKDVNLTYIVVEKQVVLKQKPTKTATEKAKEPPKYTLSGFLKDKATGEVLIGATVILKGKTTGTTTNPYGFYSLTLPVGAYSILYSYIGYKSIGKEVVLTSDKKISLALGKSESAIEEVVITNKKEEKDIVRTQMSEMKIRPTSFEKFPAFMGENDIVKSLQTLPGIKTYGDGSTAFYVRGGERDQNMILLDEAPIYNPSHLMGFFSSIMPNTMKDIDIYKGDIPSRYGGRLSSVIDIKTREGNMKQTQCEGGIGLIASNISLDGPVIKDQSSYYLSVRRSNLKWLFANNPAITALHFHDLNGKTNLKINNNNRLYISGYVGRDLYEIQNDHGVEWGNGAGTIRWNHLITDKMFSNTTLYASKYEYKLNISKENNQYWMSSIGNAGIKTDLTFYEKPGNTIRFGFGAKGHRFNPGNIKLGLIEFFYRPPYVPERSARELFLYVSNERALSDNLSIYYGIRGTLWQNIGETIEYEFSSDSITSNYYGEEEVYNHFFDLQPRISASYKFNNLSAINAGYSRTVQYLQMLSNTISPFTSLEVWMPGGPNIPPQRADHFILGYSKILNDYNMDITIESFYKIMHNQIGYVQHAEIFLNPYIENELVFGKTRSYGLEVLLKKNAGPFNGWMGYTLSKTKKHFPVYGTYPAFHDRPHDFSLFFNYQLSDHWQFATNWTYATGAAFSSPTSFYYYDGYQVPFYAEKNNDRLPAYHRLDVSVTWTFNPNSNSNFRHSLRVMVYNAYNRENPMSVNFNKIETGDANFVVPADLSGNPEKIITKQYLLGVVPSFKYIFKFL